MTEIADVTGTDRATSKRERFPDIKSGDGAYVRAAKSSSQSSNQRISDCPLLTDWLIRAVWNPLLPPRFIIQRRRVRNRVPRRIIARYPVPLDETVGADAHSMSRIRADSLSMRWSGSGIDGGWNGRAVEPFTDGLFRGLLAATFGPRFLSFAKIVFSKLNLLVNFPEEVSGRLVIHPASVRPAVCVCEI